LTRKLCTQTWHHITGLPSPTCDNTSVYTRPTE